LRFAETTVPAGQRETVGFAYRRLGHDLDAQVEIGRHAADDGELLVVLLAEHGEVGPDRREQLGHHGGDPVEVSRSRRALHPLGESAHVHRRRESVGVHHRRGRCVDGVDPGIVARLEVVVDRSRVVLEVGVLTELQRVDEDRHHHGLGPTASRPDQLEVPTVQRSHGGNQRNRAALGASAARPAAHRGGIDDHVGHVANATSAASPGGAARA
jgi:hypothetical protein